jgi:hypothetical protein
LFSIRVFKFPNMECKLEMFESFTFNSHTFSLYELLLLLFSWNFKLVVVLVFLWLVQGLIVSLKLKLQYIISLKNKGHGYYKAPSRRVLWTHFWSQVFYSIPRLPSHKRTKNIFLLAQGFHDIFSWYWIFWVFLLKCGSLGF